MKVYATKDHTIPVTEDELAWLIGKIVTVDLTFGLNRTALVWRQGELMPEAVRLLGLKRGVLNENLERAGI